MRAMGSFLFDQTRHPIFVGNPVLEGIPVLVEIIVRFVRFMMALVAFMIGMRGANILLYDSIRTLVRITGNLFTAYSDRSAAANQLQSDKCQQ
jgi:hypothetical protein